TPAEIHDRPGNLFVADFVGYRNVFPLTVTKLGDRGVVVGEGGGLTLAGRSAMDCPIGAAVLAAVRPEDLVVTDGSSGSNVAGANVARGTVRLVEYQGREWDVEVALDRGITLKARLPQAAPVGSAITLTVDPERVVVLPADERNVG